jgi:hypothetical protein
MQGDRATANADPAAVTMAGKQIAKGSQPGRTLHGRLSGVEV